MPNGKFKKSSELPTGILAEVFQKVFHNFLEKFLNSPGIPSRNFSKICSTTSSEILEEINSKQYPESRLKNPSAILSEGFCAKFFKNFLQKFLRKFLHQFVQRFHTEFIEQILHLKIIFRDCLRNSQRVLLKIIA